MPLPLLIPAAIAGVGALAKVTTGLIQSGKANRIDKRNKFPIEKLQKEYAENAANAENMARLGLPQQQYNQGIQNIQRNQSAGLRAFSRSGRTGGLASLVRASNDATLGLDVADANARQQNQRFAMGQKGILAQQKQRLFDWNSKTPYLGLLAKANALRGAGIQNQMSGFNDVSQLGIMMAGGGTPADDTMGGNFTPNSVSGISRLLGRNRQQYIGSRPSSVGINQTPYNFNRPL